MLVICLTSQGKGNDSWSLCSPSTSPHWGKGERAGRCGRRLPHLTGARERELVAVLAVCLASMGKGRERAGRCARSCITSLGKGIESWALWLPSASPHWGKGEKAGRCARRLPHLTGDREKELVAVLAVCLTSVGKGERAGGFARRLPHFTGDRQKELVSMLAMCLTSLGKGRDSWLLCSPSASPQWGKGERAGRCAGRLPHSKGDRERESWSLCSPSVSPHWGLISLGIGRESWSPCSPSASSHRG